MASCTSTSTDGSAGRTKRANRAFYHALMNSRYSDPDEDPAVQNLRNELRSEYAWRPSDDERAKLQTLAFATPPLKS